MKSLNLFVTNMSVKYYRVIYNYIHVLSVVTVPPPSFLCDVNTITSLKNDVFTHLLCTSISKLEMIKNQTINKHCLCYTSERSLNLINSGNYNFLKRINSCLEYLICRSRNQLYNFRSILWQRIVHNYMYVL